MGMFLAAACRTSRTWCDSLSSKQTKEAEDRGDGEGFGQSLGGVAAPRAPDDGRAGMMQFPPGRRVGVARCSAATDVHAQVCQALAARSRGRTPPIGRADAGGRSRRATALQPVDGLVGLLLAVGFRRRACHPPRTPGSPSRSSRREHPPPTRGSRHKQPGSAISCTLFSSYASICAARWASARSSSSPSRRAASAASARTKSCRSTPQGAQSRRPGEGAPHRRRAELSRPPRHTPPRTPQPVSGRAHADRRPPIGEPRRSDATLHVRRGLTENARRRRNP